jgi:dihydroorotate dehydrogenase
MYKHIFRPFLFLWDPETVHHWVIAILKLCQCVPGVSVFIKKALYSNLYVPTRIAGIDFPGIVGLAAGFDKNAEVYKILNSFGFSFIEIGTVTPKAQLGNTRPRLFRLPKDGALINRMGFNNKGVDYAVKSKPGDVVVGGNIGKNTLTSNNYAVADYAYCFERLYEYVDYLVVNVSCPNVKDMGQLQSRDSLGKILERLIAIRSNKSAVKPIFLKISPDLSYQQLNDILDLCIEMKIDGIIAANTTTSRNNLKTNSENISRMDSTGGLSGMPLKERTIEMIRYICKHTENKLPVISCGGVFTPDDALEMIGAGASLIQVYSGFIYEGPFMAKRINKALHKYLCR